MSGYLRAQACTGGYACMMTREQLVDAVTAVITGHQLLDCGSECRGCRKELYGQGRGESLSHHRAEKIVDIVIMPLLSARSRK